MPANESEPDNYSIDEMMDRLRSRGDRSQEGQGELVTREDGSQAYRVRKRKRRSRQPKKEKEKRDKRTRLFQVMGAGALVALTGLSALVGFVYLNTPAYRDNLVSRIEKWSGADATIHQLRVTPLRASAGATELAWPGQFPLKSLTLPSIRGDLELGALIAGKWKGSEMVSTGGGRLVVRDFAPVGPLMPENDGDCPFDFRFRAPDFTVQLGEGDAPLGRLTGTEAVYDVLDDKATTANLRFEGGKFVAPGWGEYRLIFASFQVDPSGFRLGSLRLSPVMKSDSAALVEILNPDQTPMKSGEPQELSIRLQRMPLMEMLGGHYGGWISTEVETPGEGSDGRLTIDVTDASKAAYEIPFRATTTRTSSPRWSQLPFVTRLARELNDSWYAEPAFDQAATGTIVKDHLGHGVKDLKFVARQRLTLNGRFSCDAEGKLSGELEVGLPDNTVNMAPASIRTVFSRLREGYSWATVRLSGTGREPKDDFAAQLEAAATASPIEPGNEKALDDAFRELIAPGGR